MAKKIPLGVKIISILYYILAVALVILGIGLLLGAGFISSLVSEIPVIQTLGAGLFVFAGIILILLSVLIFLLARGLWKGKSWARIVVIVLSAVGAFQSLMGIMQGDIANSVFNLAVNLIIFFYFLLNKNVRKAFS